MARSTCAGCEKKFTGLTAFDTHRTGKFYDRSRRCMSDKEMAEAGLILRDGIWGFPVENNYWQQQREAQPSEV